MKNKVLFLLAALVLLAGCEQNLAAEKTVNNSPSATHLADIMKNPFQTQRQTPETNEPLVMTKEELQAYFKRKGITPMTKERFKEPQLVVEINCSKEGSPKCRRMSGLTSHGNVMDSYDNSFYPPSDPALYFYSGKDLIKKITFQDNFPLQSLQEAHTITRVAQNGDYAAVLRHEVAYEKEGESYKNKKHKYILYFYNDFGNLVWQKDVGFGAQLEVSPNGKYVLVISNNWNLFGEGPDGPLDDLRDMGKGLNVMRLKIYNYKGEEVANYKDFAAITGFTRFGFSRNSQFFYAEVDKIYENPNTPSNHLFLLFDLEMGKLLIEKTILEQFGRDFPIQRLNYNGDGFWMGSLYDINGHEILKLPPTGFSAANTDLQDHYLILTTAKPVIKANTTYYDFVYDLVDYIAAIKNGQKPKALAGNSSMNENGINMYCVTHETTGFTKMCSYKDRQGINRKVFKTIWDEDLWQTVGWENDRNPEYTYFAITKEVGDEKHRLYYRIPE